MASKPIDITNLESRRVCIIKPSSLGDVVHALPVLAALRKRWPSAHISWVVNQGLAGLLQGHPCLDEVIRFDRGRVGLSPAGLRETGRFCGELRRREFDLAIDLQGLLRSGLMTMATGARVRLGLDNAREGARHCYTHCITVPEATRHAVDRLMLVPERLGANAGEPPIFVLPASPEAESWAAEALRGLPRPLVVFNLGARWLTKRWPPQSFAEVARYIQATFGAGLVAVGAREDQPLVDSFKRELGTIEPLDLCGKTSLPQLAAVAREANLFVSNDSGPLHLAAAAGARVVGVYTCTRPELTGPYGPRCQVVASRVWCAGSCVKQCDRMECMRELSPARVYKAVETALSPFRLSGRADVA